VGAGRRHDRAGNLNAGKPSKTTHRLTTVHGVVSFFFNVIVLALTVNIVSS
jgi:uncharacterized membrane protein